jgi:hypothetical protein
VNYATKNTKVTVKTVFSYEKFIMLSNNKESAVQQNNLAELRHRTAMISSDIVISNYYTDALGQRL